MVAKVALLYCFTDFLNNIIYFGLGSLSSVSFLCFSASADPCPLSVAAKGFDHLTRIQIALLYVCIYIYIHIIALIIESSDANGGEWPVVMLKFSLTLITDMWQNSK